MAKSDLVVRAGLVIDGSGGAPFLADIAIADGTICDIGQALPRGAEELNAAGRIVTPGFVDLHTHYDGQVMWEDRLYASSAHGVTTVVGGNCGVGFAPCRAQDREALIALMEGVEDVPEAVMDAGLPWCWETFPEYMDAVERRRYDIDVALQLPHSALRVYVMGQRALSHEPAQTDDLRLMERLTQEAIGAGAIGFGTSRFLFHRSRTGEPIPSASAGLEELRAIGRGMAAAGTGVIEAIINLPTFDEEFPMLLEFARTAGRPVSYSIGQQFDCPNAWRHALELTEAANRQGVKVKAQLMPRPTGMLLGLDLSYNPFSCYPTYRSFATLPLAERVAKLRCRDIRQKILSELPLKPDVAFLVWMNRFELMFPLCDPPQYEPAPDTSIANMARRRGVRPEEMAYDILLENEGRGILLLTVANYVDGNLDAVLEMLRHKDVVLGLGDGGAHYGMLSDSSYPTFLLAHWTRDRRGTRLGLAEAVKKLTSDTATAVGLNDRGRIAQGYKADMNVIDYHRLALAAPEVRRDLPNGGRRLIQRACGFEATIVAGEIVYREGIATGALPGRLVRGPCTAPGAT